MSAQFTIRMTGAEGLAWSKVTVAVSVLLGYLDKWGAEKIESWCRWGMFAIDDHFFHHLLPHHPKILWEVVLITIVTRKSRRPCFCLLVSLPVFGIHHAPGNGHDFRPSCVPGFWSYSSAAFLRAIHRSLIGLCFSRARHAWTPCVESVPRVPSAQNHLRKCHHFWLPAQWVIGMRVYDFNLDVVNGPKDTCISNHRNTEDGFQPEKPFWRMCYRGPAIQQLVVW